MNEAKSVIYMVASNTSNPGDETIHGFYPTRELAQKRVDAILADEDYQSEDGDIAVGIQAIFVGSEGADTDIRLR